LSAVKSDNNNENDNYIINVNNNNLIYLFRSRHRHRGVSHTSSSASSYTSGLVEDLYSRSYSYTDTGRSRHSSEGQHDSQYYSDSSCQSVTHAKTLTPIREVSATEMLARTNSNATERSATPTTDSAINMSPSPSSSEEEDGSVRALATCTKNMVGPFHHIGRTYKLPTDTLVRGTRRLTHHSDTETYRVVEDGKLAETRVGDEVTLEIVINTNSFASEV